MLDYQELLSIADEANLSDNPILKARDILFYHWAFDELTTMYMIKKMREEGMLNE